MINEWKDLVNLGNNHFVYLPEISNILFKMRDYGGGEG
jgi:hypothetical protein